MSYCSDKRLCLILYTYDPINNQLLINFFLVCCRPDRIWSRRNLLWRRLRTRETDIIIIILIISSSSFSSSSCFWARRPRPRREPWARSSARRWRTRRSITCKINASTDSSLSEIGKKSSLNQQESTKTLQKVIYIINCLHHFSKISFLSTLSILSTFPYDHC